MFYPPHQCTNLLEIPRSPFKYLDGQTGFSHRQTCLWVPMSRSSVTLLTFILHPIIHNLIRNINHSYRRLLSQRCCAFVLPLNLDIFIFFGLFSSEVLDESLLRVYQGSVEYIFVYILYIFHIAFLFAIFTLAIPGPCFPSPIICQTELSMA